MLPRKARDNVAPVRARLALAIAVVTWSARALAQDALSQDVRPPHVAELAEVVLPDPAGPSMG